jgi:AAA family ATP:ADP antiporter
MFGSFADIRPDERRLTWTAFMVLFGVMLSHSMLEAARDALFLASLPPQRLPWVYLGVAFFSLLLYLLQEVRGVHVRVSDLSRLLLLSAVVNVVFWFGVGQTDAWILYALYMWPGVLATTVIVRFWTLAAGLFSVGQAKRLFTMIGAGSVLGAIAGSAAARGLVSLRPDVDLLLGSAVALVLTALGPVLVLPRRQTQSGDEGERRKRPLVLADLFVPLRLTLQRPYLRHVGSLLLVSTLSFTIVDYLFKSIVSERVAAGDLAEFFSSTYVVLNVLSLVAQVFLVGRLMRAWGVNQVLGILPVLFVLGGFGVILGGGLVAALLLKGFDGMLRNSLHRTASEVLYVPLPGEVRNVVKGWLDVLGQRGGQALASVLILIVVSLGFGLTTLALVLVGLTLVWIRLIHSLEGSYVDLFRETLQKVAGRATTGFQELDLETFETLLERLNSANDAEVIAALDLLEDQGRVHVIPALILYHPNCEVVQRALEIFTRAGRDDVAPITRRLLDSPNQNVRAAAIRALSWLAPPDPELYESHTNDASPIVRATALVGLVSFVQSAPAAVQLAHMARQGTLEEKIALARAIRWNPGSGYEDVLVELSGDANHDLKLHVIDAMVQIRSAQFIRPLIDMLPARDLRPRARACLVAIGPDALATADRLLGDQQFDASVRRHLVRAITQFEPQEAATILMRHLGAETHGDVRYRILRGLGRLRAAHPAIELDAESLRRTLEATVSRLYQLLDWRLQLQAASASAPLRATEVQELILLLLQHKERLAGERLFRLIGLLHPSEDMASVYRGVHSSSLHLRDSSRELLEYVLDVELREPVLALLDDIPDAVRLRRAGRFHDSREQTYEELLAELLQHDDVGLRALVVYHIGELRLTSLRETVAMLPSDLKGFVARGVERTLNLLDGNASQQITREV